MIQSDAAWEDLSAKASVRLSRLMKGRFFFVIAYPGIHEEEAFSRRRGIVDQFWRHVWVAQARVVAASATLLFAAALAAIALGVWVAGGWG